jgi:hypothetical protein
LETYQDSSEEMSEAASENGKMRNGEGNSSILRQRVLGLPDSFSKLLVLRFADTILCQQLLEDVGSGRIQILRKIEGQRFLARFIFKSVVTTTTSKLGG